MSVKTTATTLKRTDAAPLGAHFDGNGASSVAEAVELCLFDDSGQEARYSLEQGEGGVWQGYLGGVEPGQPRFLEAPGTRRTFARAG